MCDKIHRTYKIYLDTVERKAKFAHMVTLLKEQMLPSMAFNIPGVPGVVNQNGQNNSFK